MTKYEKTQLISSKELKRITKEILMAHSLPEEQAEITAKVLVKADLMGKSSHGVIRLLPFYIPLLKNGTINIHSECSRVYEDKNIVHIDARKGLGPYVSYNAMSECISYAKETGTGAVSVLNGTHFGIASYYSLMASEQNLIGISITNGSPAVVPPGGKKALTGTNAISLTFPRDSDFPITFDMGLSAISLGKLLVAKDADKMVSSYLGAYSLLKKHNVLNEKKIDPDMIYKERMLAPLGAGDLTGEYKGFQIGLIIDFIISLVFNGKFSFQHLKGEASYVFIAINPFKFISENTYNNKMKIMTSMLEEYEVEEGFECIRIPGERAHKLMVQRKSKGIPLERRVMEELLNECSNLGIPYK